VTDSVVLHPVSTAPTEAAVVTVELNDDHTTAHVGLLYQSNEDETPQHLHLAWHMRLQNDSAAPLEAYWVKPHRTADELEAVADTAHLVATQYQDGGVPYAFDPADARFTPDGTLQRDQSRGLTCATFLVVLFEYAGIHLVERTTWEQHRSAERRREDEKFQRKLVEHLRRTPDHRAHADLIASEVGCTRFRAEEVAAASGMTGHPVPFARAEPAGRRVLAMLREQHAA
jgi:hypothetical protein